DIHMRNVVMLSLIGLLWGMAWAQQPTSYQKTAQAALNSQISQEGKDCPDARTTRDENICTANVVSVTERDFDVFYQSLLGLLGTEPGNQQKLREAQEQWLKYRDKTCEAVAALYDGGTIRPSAVSRCEIQLTRSRMRDLDSAYYTVLHN